MAILVQLGGHRSGSPIRGWAQIDEEEAPDILRHNWSLIEGYAARPEIIDGKRRMVRMHRQILGLAPFDPLEGDHINRDKLDNRRSNLRAVPHLVNTHNVSPRRDASSGRRGVRVRNGRCQARVTIAGVDHHLGSFDSVDEAAERARSFRVSHMAGAVD